MFDDILGFVGNRDSGASRGKRAVEAYTDGGSNYPFMETEAGELKVEDVEVLLRIYKDVVRKYTSLRKAIGSYAIPKIVPSLNNSQEANIELDQELKEQTEKPHEVAK